MQGSGCSLTRPSRAPQIPIKVHRRHGLFLVNRALPIADDQAIQKTALTSETRGGP
jgi:hypothetical protein